MDYTDAADLARGAAFLGSGGGGDPHTSLLELEAELARGAKIFLIEPSDLADDALVAPCGWMGAPTVSDEKLPSGREAIDGLRRLEALLGRKVDAVFPIEIGGSNALAPLILAAKAGVPVVDCDGMGRAFPESQMVVFNIQGQAASPAILTDGRGAAVVIEADNQSEELIARAVSIAMGGSCHVIDYVCSGLQVKRGAVKGTVGLATKIGRSIRLAREAGRDPFEGLFASLAATEYAAAGVLIDGRITDLQRDTKGGFAIGHVTITGFGVTTTLELEFQNENLVARQGGAVRAMVPDIITVLDRETAETITTERLKYGQRVKVVGASAPACLRTAAALAVLGPSAFKLAEPYRSIEALNCWKVAS